MGHIYDDVRTLAVGLRSLFVGCIRGSANSVAHCLAHYAGQLDEELLWLEESPPLALHTLYLDASSLNDWMNSRFAFQKNKNLYTKNIKFYFEKFRKYHTYNN